MAATNAPFDPIARGQPISARKCLLFVAPVLEADVRFLIAHPATTPPDEHLPAALAALLPLLGTLEAAADGTATEHAKEELWDAIQITKECAVMDQEWEIAAYLRDVGPVFSHPDRAARALRAPFAPRAPVGTERPQRYAELFAEVFGPEAVAFDPAWRTDTAVAIARAMYDSHEFGAMPILADALQDAGCEDEQILNHCRDANHVHVRGCWVCDLVLSLG
jgi:hypothetical protein